MRIQRVTDDDRPWIADTIASTFASTRVASRGRLIDDVSQLDGYIAELDGHPIGVALWLEVDGAAELVAIVTTYRGAGAGVALLDAAVEHARDAGWKRLWLITTNDNTDALRIYQRAGWDWIGFHRNSIEQSRVLKPEIPTLGQHGIPIAHELEFEYPL
ncbi:MAG TPA: GNAT family N-acetyltransferase [Acidimicrobiia bacterium]|nr:GNAT family N-acetyltransferase [Acidimicrobiia bacterium]